MAQPKEPPLSIRAGAERLAKIDAYASTLQLTRHAAVLALVDRGLAVLPSERARAAQVAAEAAALAEQRAISPKPFKSRLKGVWKAP